MRRVRYLAHHPVRGVGLELRDLADRLGLWDRLPHRCRERIWKALGMPLWRP